MRIPRKDDLRVTIDGLGVFEFGQRRMAEEIRIQSQYSKYLDGAEPTPWLANVAGILSTLKVLMVSGPDGYGPGDLDSLDPLEEDVYRQLQLIHGGLRKAEDAFRGRVTAPVPNGGQESDPAGGLGVPSPVSAGADGPQVSGGDSGGNVD